MSDTEQTDAGRSFWVARLSEALQMNLYCYGYDRMTNVLEEINIEDQRVADYYWGTDTEHQWRVLLISKHKLVNEKRTRLI